MTDTMTTEKVLDSLLKENTGRHMLDSGGAYGRHWERNQGRDFEKEQTTVLSFRWGMELTHNVYHWLLERVDYAPEWQEKLDAFANTEEMKREPWLHVCEMFIEHLREKGHTVEGPHGSDEAWTINTYNHTSLLSQTLQYMAAEVDGEPLYLIQIHNGADVRGGYTSAKCFTDNGMYEWGLLDDQRGMVYCEDREVCGATWTTDDGYNLWADGREYEDLGKYKIVKHGDGHGDIEEITAPAKGIIYVNEDGVGCCPVCGKAALCGST